MNLLEVQKFLGALEKYVLRKQRLPNQQVLEAIDTLSKYFSIPQPHADVCITADMIIGMHRVRLEPPQLSLDEVEQLMQEDLQKAERLLKLRKKRL